MVYTAYAVSFTAGAALMGLEMVGSRILAPVFGSSILVWGSLIGVVLTALSLGYYAGGYLADRQPHLGAMSWVLGVAGFWIGIIPAAQDALLSRLVSRFPGVPATLWACLILFFVPSLLLATVSPWCARLVLRGLDKAGRTTGVLFAVSNAGSISGTFLTSFYLIPRIGVEAILRWTSILLIALALCLAALLRPRRTAAASILMAVLVVYVSSWGFAGEAKGSGVVYEVQSLYHHIYVIDEGDTRLLKFDSSIQGGMFPDDPYESVYPYTDYFHLALALKDDIKDVLVIGLGAGTVPKRFEADYPDMKVECVELDPEVVRVARRYFEFPSDDRIKVHVSDGRVFLKETEKTYDLIVLDAYYADAIPFHLATVEFYELVKSRLRPGGVLASNLIGALQGERSKLFRSMYLTISRVFPDTYVFPVRYSPGSLERMRNIEVFAVAPGGGTARMSKSELMAKARSLEGGLVRLDTLSELASEVYEGSISREGAVILTDDYAPVDSLLYLY